MAEEPEIDFGTFLRKARERRGMSLQQVAATTKISARVLGALEQNDPSKLPGGIFARAFVRAYAREVGLDPEATVARFVDDFPESAAGEDGTGARTGDDPQLFESGRRAAVTVLQLVGISVLVVVAILIYFNTRPASVVPETPSAVPGVGPQQEPRTAAEPPSATTTAPGAAGFGLPAAAATTPALVEPPAPPPSSAPLSLAMVAIEPCWVSLTVDGSEVLSRLLDRGERVAFDGRESMTLKAGNAGALQLTWNGRRGRPFGESGRVVTRTITPATLAEFIER